MTGARGAAAVCGAFARDGIEAAQVGSVHPGGIQVGSCTRVLHEHPGGEALQPIGGDAAGVLALAGRRVRFVRSVRFIRFASTRRLQAGERAEIPAPAWSPKSPQPEGRASSRGGADSECHRGDRARGRMSPRGHLRRGQPKRIQGGHERRWGRGEAAIPHPMRRIPDVGGISHEHLQSFGGQQDSGGRKSGCSRCQPSVPQRLCGTGPTR